MNSIGTPLMWWLFAAFVVLALVVDFIALNKQGAHKVSMREAAVWSLIWVGVSAAFAGWLWWYLGAPRRARGGPVETSYSEPS